MPIVITDTPVYFTIHFFPTCPFIPTYSLSLLLLAPKKKNEFPSLHFYSNLPLYSGLRVYVKHLRIHEHINTKKFSQTVKVDNGNIRQGGWDKVGNIDRNCIHSFIHSFYFFLLSWRTGEKVSIYWRQIELQRRIVFSARLNGAVI